ncbi:MAG: membrane protein insertase YidC [Desulfobacteraceae bacterium]|nr:membrane protein insertase YidC [Desulfobacteraceae bacterium]
MEHVRLLSAIVLTIMVFMLWELVFVPEKQVEPPKAPEQSETKKQPSPEKQEHVAKQVTEEPAKQETPEPVEVSGGKIKTISVETDLYRAEISEKGAAIKRFVLKQYKEDMQNDGQRKVIVPEENRSGTALVRFAGPGLPDASQALFATDFDSKDLSVKDKAEAISFYWRTEEGLTLEKRYTFYPGSYKVGLTVNIVNRSEGSIPSDLALEMTNPPPKGSTFVFQGPFAYIDQDLEEIDVDDIEDKSVYSGKIRWAGIEDRYFMTALVPADPAKTELRLSLDKNPEILRVAYLQPGQSLAPGESRQVSYDLFMGPKRMSELKAFGHDLDRVINFGFFDIIARPCLWLMNQIHNHVVSNYGVAIILLTIIFKIIFWPLGNKSYRSMAEMKRLQPMMAELRKKYKDDKKKMNEEVMRLYKTYKVNPMSGCLPMVVQIPVFIAFYRMLYESIELRHAPFMLWINDLSAPDRLFRFDITVPFMAPPYGIPVLTVIMGATMFLQQKLSPPPGDPSQAKMMMLMPLIFTVIFINFPSGLVLYWLTNNVLSIAQQYHVTRKIV